MYKNYSNLQTTKQVLGIFLISLLYFFASIGCTPTYNYRYVPTTNRQQEPVPNEVTEDKLPTILPGKLTTPQKLISQFKNIGTISMKTEFETAEQANQKRQQFEAKPIFSHKFYVCAYMDYDNFYSIKYDPYSKMFSYKILNYPFNIDRAWTKREENPFSVLISSKITGSSKYRGTNAFGVSKLVDKTNFGQVGINFVNKYSIPVNSSSEIHGNSIQIEPNEAQILKPNLALAFEFTPALHYVDKDAYGVIGKSYDRTEPTIDSPSEYVTNSTVLYAKLEAIYLIDKKTLKVYGMIEI